MDFEVLSKNKEALIARLSSRKMRKREGLFTVEGTKCVADTLGGFTLEMLVATPGWLSAHSDLAEKYRDSVRTADIRTLQKLSSLSTPPEVIALYRLPERRLPPSAPLSPGLYLLLDGVQDPGNLGTIIRTAHWFGVKHIFASTETADLFNPKTIQSTMGAVKAVEVTYCDLPELVAGNPDMPLFILDLQGTPIGEANLPESALVAMGSEGHGLSDRLKTLATDTLTIPPASPADHPDSLNVAIATALTLAKFTHTI